MAAPSLIVWVLMAKNIAAAWMAWSLNAARNWATSRPRNVRERRWSAGWNVVMGAPRGVDMCRAPRPRGAARGGEKGQYTSGARHRQRGEGEPGAAAPAASLRGRAPPARPRRWPSPGG